ncbi:MAG: DUF389 domain-containing protein [Muribaculaceae bacterium]|nr:DUF389 domain-containing protein [Muribaculaceae bacterium]
MLPKQSIAGFLSRLKDYFNIGPFLIPQADAEAAIREGVSFRGINLLILIVAIFIASLGLNTNSTAVIIGAMLISPLMGPIIGIGLAVGIHDFDLIKRSFRNLMMATLFSVATSCIYFLISPVSEGHSELLARTSPTIYDVAIGFFGGAAGILAIGSRIKGNVLPGVAIATALMPPLCTVGYGLATMQPHYFVGAIYLFFINSVFIATATTVGVKLMKYKIHDFSNPRRAVRVRRIVYSIAFVTVLPAVWLTYNMLVTSNFNNNCSRFVAAECRFPATQVLSYTATRSGAAPQLTVTLVGAPLPQDSLLAALDSRLPQYHLAGTRLSVLQGTVTSGTDIREASASMLRDMYAVTQATISAQQAKIDSLQRVLTYSRTIDSMGLRLAPELRVVFPDVERIAIAHTVVTDITTGTADTVNVALTAYHTPPDTAGSNRLREYLRARLRLPDLELLPVAP